MMNSSILNSILEKSIDRIIPIIKKAFVGALTAVILASSVTAGVLPNIAPNNLAPVAAIQNSTQNENAGIKNLTIKMGHGEKITVKSNSSAPSWEDSDSLQIFKIKDALTEIIKMDAFLKGAELDAIMHGRTKPTIEVVKKIKEAQDVKIKSVEKELNMLGVSTNLAGFDEYAAKLNEVIGKVSLRHVEEAVKNGDFNKALKDLGKVATQNNVVPSVIDPNL